MGSGEHVRTVTVAGWEGSAYANSAFLSYDSKFKVGIQRQFKLDVAGAAVKFSNCVFGFRQIVRLVVVVKLADLERRHTQGSFPTTTSATA